MNAKKCDRCGAYFDGNDEQDMFVANHAKYGVNLAIKDLCPTCYAELEQWYERKPAPVQKNRVLTLDEVREQVLCWVEEAPDWDVPEKHREPADWYPAIYHMDVVDGACMEFSVHKHHKFDHHPESRSYDGSVHKRKREYGKTWRCWLCKPTDEEREATPWET